MTAPEEKDETKRAPQQEPVPSAEKKPQQPVRAINEDDDGYDPYSDLHDQRRPEPLFERDPWS